MSVYLKWIDIHDRPMNCSTLLGARLFVRSLRIVYNAILSLWIEFPSGETGRGRGRQWRIFSTH